MNTEGILQWLLDFEPKPLKLIAKDHETNLGLRVDVMNLSQETLVQHLNSRRWKRTSVQLFKQDKCRIIDDLSLTSLTWKEYANIVHRNSLASRQNNNHKTNPETGKSFLFNQSLKPLVQKVFNVLFPPIQSRKTSFGSNLSSDRPMFVFKKFGNFFRRTLVSVLLRRRCPRDSSS